MKNFSSRYPVTFKASIVALVLAVMALTKYLMHFMEIRDASVHFPGNCSALPACATTQMAVVWNQIMGSLVLDGVVAIGIVVIMIALFRSPKPCGVHAKS